MNRKDILLIVFIAISFAVAAVFILTEDDAKSPRLVWSSVAPGPGSGHAFGYDTVYTVTRHATHDGRKMAVCTSGEKGVEIWSPIPDLTRLPEGSQFRLSKAGTWQEAFSVVRRGH